MSSRIVALLACCFAGVAAIPATAQGYQVQPMVATIAPTGTDSSLRLLVKNTGSVPITVEFIPFRLSVDAVGTPTRTNDERDLLVFPPQTIVPPGREQAVQVRYVGDGTLAEARVYGIRVNQVPVDVGQGSAAGGAVADVKIGFNFLSHIIVSPPGAKAAVSAGDVTRRADGSVAMKLVNDGNGVAVLGELTWQISDAAGKTATLTSNEIDAGNFGALMPHEKRPASVAAKSLTALSGPVKVAMRQP